MTTVAVVDLAHCGTTMVAGILERIGVPVVLGRDNGKLEDQSVIGALRNTDQFQRLIDERRGLMWGFKFPARGNIRLCGTVSLIQCTWPSTKTQ